MVDEVFFRITQNENSFKSHSTGIRKGAEINDWAIHDFTADETPISFHIELKEADGFLFMSEDLIGSVFVEVSVSQTVLLTKWASNNQVYVVEPFPLGKHSYQFELYGIDAKYIVIFVVKEVGAILVLSQPTIALV